MMMIHQLIIMLCMHVDEIANGFAAVCNDSVRHAQICKLAL